MDIFTYENQLEHALKHNQCHICHLDYEPQSILVSLNSCQHVFHQDCINEWLNYGTTCPLCRQPVTDQYQTINLFQYLIMLLSLSSPPVSPQITNNFTHAHSDSTLANTAFVSVFLHILVDTYKTATEYNMIRQNIFRAKEEMVVDEQRLMNSINVSNRTSASRELRYRQELLRSQLLQMLWTQQDPYHIDEPPILPYGKQLYQHPYLLMWREKIIIAFRNYDIIIPQ